MFPRGLQSHVFAVKMATKIILSFIHLTFVTSSCLYYPKLPFHVTLDGSYHHIQHCYKNCFQKFLFL